MTARQRLSSDRACPAPITVGRRNHNPRVGGSSPSSATIFPNDYSAFAWCRKRRRWGGFQSSVNQTAARGAAS